MLFAPRLNEGQRSELRHLYHQNGSSECYASWSAVAERSGDTAFGGVAQAGRRLANGGIASGERNSIADFPISQNRRKRFRATLSIYRGSSPTSACATPPKAVATLCFATALQDALHSSSAFPLIKPARHARLSLACHIRISQGGPFRSPEGSRYRRPPTFNFNFQRSFHLPRLSVSER
jgi:hypothetical protein